MDYLLDFFRNCILNFSLNAHKRKLEPIFFLFMSANFLQSQKKNNIELGLWIYLYSSQFISVMWYFKFKNITTLQAISVQRESTSLLDGHWSVKCPHVSTFSYEVKLQSYIMVQEKQECWFWLSTSGVFCNTITSFWGQRNHLYFG